MHPARRGASRVLPAAMRVSPKCRRGMTLLELLLSLAGLGLIGATITAMLAAVSYGTQSEKHMQALIIKRQAVVGRIDDAVRDAREVIDTDTGELVLWMSDDNGDGEAGTGELLVIQHDPSNNRLMAYHGQEDQSVSLTNLLGGVLDALDRLLTGPEFEPERWADGVTDWSVTLDDENNPRQARLVSHRVTLTKGQMQEQAISAAAVGGE
jgi:type II secretory pathway pseudopilin PulG